MVKQINHIQLKKLIRHYYESKLALLVYGTFGIGKSHLVRDTAQEIGEKKKRKFVDWNKLTAEEKEVVFNNPEKYFVLMDIRLSEYDSSDIKGLPDFKKDSNSITWKIPFWAKLLEKPTSDGILFFDEINLATPLVISSVYKIIYDRVINDGKIADDWFIMGCGNLSEDRAYTHDLNPPVRDRGGEVELVFDSESWIDWAVKNGISPEIIGFVSFKNSVLHCVDYDDKQKFTTPRGWERLNTLIKDVKDIKEIDLLSSTAIGEGIAKEFLAFVKLRNQVDLEAVLKNPEKFKDIKEISSKYFVLTAFAERYKEKKVDFDKIIRASETLDKMNNPEFVALLWRLCIRYDRNKFVKEFSTHKDMKKLSTKYKKYLLNDEE